MILTRKQHSDTPESKKEIFSVRVTPVYPEYKEHPFWKIQG